MNGWMAVWMPKWMDQRVDRWVIDEWSMNGELDE